MLVLAKAHATKGRVLVVAAAAWAAGREGRLRKARSGPLYLRFARGSRFFAYWVTCARLPL